jgi:hypothetical protein
MWGGLEYIVEIVSGMAVIGVGGWFLVMAATQGRPRRRVRGVFTLVFAVAGFGAGGVASPFFWLYPDLLSRLWPWMGLLIGMSVGNVVGRLAWVVWLKPGNEEVGS